jgi:hypothetical protein
MSSSESNNSAPPASPPSVSTSHPTGSAVADETKPPNGDDEVTDLEEALAEAGSKDKK